MLPETDAEVQEFLLQTGFDADYLKTNDNENNNNNITLKRLLDETKDYIDR